MITTCQNCPKEFYVKPSWYKKGRGKFCSRACANSFYKTTEQIPNVVCAFCKVKFYKKESSLKNSKSGLFFCSRIHKDKAQRLNGIKEIQPAHYGTSQHGNSPTYRNIAFNFYPGQCDKCGYDRYEEVLDVHHRDRNRRNNHPTNLQILCPTCHTEGHFESKTGRYSLKKRI